MKNRMPAVAGTFYPATATALKNQVSKLFENATTTPVTEVAALIVPHAGYVYSGEVAASAYAKLDRKAQFQNIFIIARSHRKLFNGVSIFPKGHYIIPSGEVQINEETAFQLMENHKFIYYDEEADQAEHSVEVQLPFLQYWLSNDFKIIPLVIGSNDPIIYEKLANALRPWFNSENLFVISTDFSHYPSYDIARKTDEETVDAIIANDGEQLKKCCEKNEHSFADHLVTGLCGAAAVQTLLHLTQNNTEITFEKIVYRNSGDVLHGDKRRVVGYWAIAANRKTNTLNLASAEKDALLKIARESIGNHLKNNKDTNPEKEFQGIINEHYGAFVTLKKEGMLRGCIGRFTPNQPLSQTIKEMAIAAATRDLRFDPLTIEELNQVKIEISILTPLKKIESFDQIIPGMHGIYIKKGLNSGTFLPQVALETNWTLEELLGHCARDKAGIGWEGWKTAELFTYEAIVFEET